jgi:hypothetical protein
LPGNPQRSRPQLTIARYTETTLSRAIREGVGPSGSTLSPLMPRFALNDATMCALIDYLRTLSPAPAAGRGIAGKRLRVGTHWWLGSRAAAWLAKAHLSYPFDLPEQRRLRMTWPLTWFKTQGIKVTEECTQVDTYLSCVILAESVESLWEISCATTWSSSTRTC